MDVLYGGEEPYGGELKFLAVSATLVLTLLAAIPGTSPASNSMEFKLLKIAQVYLLHTFYFPFSFSTISGLQRYRRL